MFEGFALERIDVGAATLRVRHGGSGPPLLLLHGHPRTHATWHRVAPLLAADHTVVCPDLRGYGESSKPPTSPDHAPYSKRAMAGDCLALMAALGHDRFAVAGHDRGSYVALRLALDHPRAVTALAALDSVPIGEALARCDARFAAAWWHWFFLGQTARPAERVISADPDAWYGADGRNAEARMGAEAFADFRRAIRDPATVHPSTDPRDCRMHPGGESGAAAEPLACHSPWVGLGWPGTASTARVVPQPNQPGSMRRSYKFLLRPTGRQTGSLTVCLEDHRQLYNGALEHRRTAWRMGRVAIRYRDQSAALKDIRQADRRGQGRWSFSSQQATLRRLDRAMAAFFRRTQAGQAPGYPRFKGVAGSTR